ncbi:MAG: hypothetical protein KME23_13170 [Goleter apudmare HA4340-LM2]|nr:hypothetical protein [Goleter apudmare HA4340-LM2]
MSPAVIIFPKIACAQTYNRTIELDNLYTVNPLQQTKVKDLERKNIEFQTCSHDDSELPKVTSVDDLEDNVKKNPSCDANNIQQAESLPKQIDAKPRIEQLDINQTSPTPEQVPADPDYIISPRIAAKNKIRPLTTTIPLNNTQINHLTERQFFVGTSFGDSQNTTFDVNGIIKLNSQVQESLTRNNIFTVDQTGEYLQLQTVRKSREVIVSLQQPQTILGTNLQLSLTASCLFPGTNPEDVCTYTPGLTSADIDPNTFTPSRIFQTSNVGDVVTPASLAAIQQPGFQTGADGQDIGVNLLLPNTGTVSGDTISITRREEIKNTPTVFYSRVRQIVRANDSKAVIGRTVRGFGLILNDDNTLLNTALQLGSTVLPDVIPNIAGSEKPVKSNVNNNLFFAANNIRLPANSFTAYYAGIGSAQNVPRGVTSLNQVPNASFHGIWLGASPVIKRSTDTNAGFVQIGPQTVIGEGSGEGGFNSDVSFFSNINGEVFSTQNLQNFYSQVYVTILSQDANYVFTSRYREEINYAPHLSFTGNITGTRDVLRYYTGVIGAEKVKVYGGVDFTQNTTDGWTFAGGLLAYINPDIDYYSRVVGNVTKRISLSKNNNLVLATGLNYAFDRESRSGDLVNSLTLSTRLNLGDVWFGLTNYTGDVLPDSIKNTLVTSFGIQFNRNFSLSAYYTPINDNTARSPYGATARFTLGKNPDSPILNLSWKNNEYSYGQDPSGNELQTNDNVFTVFLRGTF